MTTTVLSLRGAKKRFGRTTALAGAEFDLHQGEWLALLGPNGAGKTTLIRALAGRVRLDAGEVRLFGEPVAGPDLRRGGLSAPRRRLGIVPQEIAVFPLLTARENLRTFGRLAGLAGADLRERVEWALEWTALADRASEPVRGFSGGMKRRLNIACGVMHGPDVVLLDEPTVGVDPQSRERIWEMLLGLRAGGTALLLTTHHLDEAQQFCDRIVIIDHGRVIAQGRLDELVRNTVGEEREVTITLDCPDGAPPAVAAAGWVADDTGRRLHRRVGSIGAELADILAAVSDAGCVVEDVHVEAPSLHAVFIHLTGRELRE